MSKHSSQLMKVRSIKTVFFLITIFLCLPFGNAYAGLYSGKIAVMPFIKGEKADVDIPAVDTAITKFPFLENSLAVDADKVMTNLLHKSLDKKFDHVILMETAAAEFKTLLEEEKEPTVLLLAVKLGKKLNADYVVAGNVWRFQERSGNSLATNKPASISFKVYLISVATSTRIWKGESKKTQKALSEDVLKAKEFFKQGGKWLTVKELAANELEKMLKTFPLKRGY